MLVQRPASCPVAGSVRCRLPRAQLTTRAALSNWQVLNAGKLINCLNEEALSKSDQRVRRIKTCLDEVLYMSVPSICFWVHCQ